MLNIGIVNDTAIAVEALYRTITATPDYHLLWFANTGVEAVKYCVRFPPDLILMDLNMPELDGVEATRQIMQCSPCAILIVTASIDRNSVKVFQAIGHGALDVVTTPALGSDDPQATQLLLKKMADVMKLAKSSFESPFHNRLDTHPTADQFLSHRGDAFPLVSSSQVGSFADSQADSRAFPQLVVIGASTGGPNALQHILSQIPACLNAAVVVIQHIDAQFAAGFVDWLNQTSQLPVALARNGDRPEIGKILVAGTNDHLILRPNRTLRYTRAPADLPYRPSVDVFFQSVAQYWPQPGVALLLTGMGRDGADGMAKLQAARWYTIAEDAESCVVFGMPKAAIERGVVRQVLPLEKIAPAVVSALPSLNTHF